ncbi:hypothetical protein C8Q73DRAFT_347229 [Cubamyces lactineus]|nr:hypothetical protein C8Q73DRAFT_347229 [Cubamyces lactineus]
MSSNEDSWVYVDDADPRIVYSHGDWISSVHRGSSSKREAWSGTLHGTTAEGATATITFTGSEVGVVTSGLTNQDGWPAVDISIDGIQQAIHTLPMGNVNARTTRFTNFTFLTSLVDLGDHVLTITHINGTASNPFWLDCIFFKSPPHSTDAWKVPYPSSEGSLLPTAGIGPSMMPSSSETFELKDSPLFPFTLSGFSRYTEATDARTSPVKNHTGIIVGGILGGVVGATLLALIGYYCFKHRKKYWYHADDRSG